MKKTECLMAGFVLIGVSGIWNILSIMKNSEIYSVISILFNLLALSYILLSFFKKEPDQTKQEPSDHSQ